MARISTHVLDVSTGTPAEGITVEIFFGRFPRAVTRTNADGRTETPLLSAEAIDTGGYSLIFHVGDYFRTRGVQAFYENIKISFLVNDGAANYHVPLLLSPFGYSTYRGS